MAAQISAIAPALDHQQRLADFGRRVLDRINTTPMCGLTNRTAGAVWIDLLREARRFDLLDDDYGGNLR